MQNELKMDPLDLLMDEEVALSFFRAHSEWPTLESKKRRLVFKQRRSEIKRLR